MPRSLRLHDHHLPTVKSSLLRNGFPSQKLLAEALQLSQSTVSNFLNGKPVDFVNFTEICRVLGKEWRDVADFGDSLPTPTQSAEPVRRTIFLRDWQDPTHQISKHQLSKHQPEHQGDRPQVGDVQVLQQQTSQQQTPQQQTPQQQVSQQQVSQQILQQQILQQQASQQQVSQQILQQKLSQQQISQQQVSQQQASQQQALQQQVSQQVSQREILRQKTISPQTSPQQFGQRGGERSLPQQLQQALQLSGHDVLLGNGKTAPGVHLSQVDYWLLILSPTTMTSEIVWEELQILQDLHQVTPQKPALFPLWYGDAIACSSYFVVPLNDLVQSLQHLQLWRWNGNITTLVAELLPLIKQGRTALPSPHPWAMSWQQALQPVDRPVQSFPLLSDRPSSPPEIPEGQVLLDSPFYLSRPPIEHRCFETIQHPGALIRIKAPRQMGKSSLLVRILREAEGQGDRILNLNLQLANKRVFANSDTFLQWFCASLALELGQLEAVTSCWQLAPMIGSNQCCKAFLEQQVLADSLPPLTLGLDEVDRVFESPEIADDFFGLLRALHEEAKRRPLWQKLRLVVVHSTEVYIPLDVNKSPFNVGLPIELPEFTPAQVQTLAQRHGLDWTATSVSDLMSLVGGHPYLVRLALYHLAQGNLSLTQILQEGATEGGIYTDHLRRHWWNLEQHPPLLTAMQEVVSASQGVVLRSPLAFKLHSMGLIHLEGNTCQVRCGLYREYFGDRLG